MFITCSKYKLITKIYSNKMIFKETDKFVGLKTQKENSIS